MTKLEQQRIIEKRRESLRMVENAPNRGQWDYRAGLREAEKRLAEAEAELKKL